MAVKTLVGDLFSSQAQTLVNTVNTVGVMGKGIALEFRKRFPEMHRDYLRRCESGLVRLGEPYLFKSLVPPWILNFPTKEHWRSVSRVSDLARGLQYLESHYRDWGITSLAIPPLGCGLGQLEWRVVGPTLYRHLQRLEIPVELYAPHGTPATQLESQFLEAAPGERGGSSDEPRKIDPAWVALVQVLAQISKEPYHWPVGRTTFQKIAYFATEEGVPTGLNFSPASFGPFAPELKPLIGRLVNNGLLVETKAGRMFKLEPGPTLSDAAEAYQDQISKWKTQIDRIADLFLRMNTDQAEIAATVFFAARHLIPIQTPGPTEAEVLEAVKRWKQKRRPPLREEDVARMIRVLALLGWLQVRPSLGLPQANDALVEA